MARGLVVFAAVVLVCACGDDGPAAGMCEPGDSLVATAPDDALVDVAFALGEGVVGVAVHEKGTGTLALRSYELATGELLAEHTVTAPDEIAACPPTSPTCRGGMVMAASDAGFAVLWPALVFDDTGFPADPYANNVYLVGYDAAGEGVSIGPTLVHPQDGTDLVDATPRAIAWDGEAWLLAWTEVREAPAQMGRIHTFHVNVADASGPLSFAPAIEVPRSAIIRPDTAIARHGETLVVGWLEREGDPTRDDVWWYVRDLAADTGHLEARPSDDQTRRSPALVRTADGFAYGWKVDDGDYDLLALDAAGQAGALDRVRVEDAPGGYRLVALEDVGAAIVGITASELSIVEPGGAYAQPTADNGAIRDAIETAGGTRALYTRPSGGELEVRVADACR